MSAKAKKRGRASIYLFSDDPDSSEMMKSAFSSLGTYDVRRTSIEEVTSGSLISPDQIDIAIVDVEDGRVLDQSQFKDLLQQLHGIPIIYVSGELEQDRIRQLIKLEGADWLQKPLRRRSLIESVNQLTEKSRVAAKKAHAVLSCGGGSGGTSVAIMLAYFLAKKNRRSEPNTALFDLDFSKADVGAYLNIENEYRLESALANPDRVDLEFVDVIRKVHEAKFSVFSFEFPVLPFSENGNELALKLLDLVSFQHDHTLLDLSSTAMPWQANILGAADTVTIVSNVSLPSLQRAKHLRKEIEKMRGSEHGIYNVINRVKESVLPSQFGKKQLIKLFGRSDVVILPEEREMMLQALNRGVLPIEVSERSAFCKRLRDLAEELRGGSPY